MLFLILWQHDKQRVVLRRYDLLLFGFRVNSSVPALKFRNRRQTEKFSFSPRARQRLMGILCDRFDFEAKQNNSTHIYYVCVWNVYIFRYNLTFIPFYILS